MEEILTELLLVLQSQNSINEFREEFDFEAMNEKFKKDEVWGYLGKEKKKHNCDDIEDDAIEQWSRDKAALGLVKNIDAKVSFKLFLYCLISSECGIYRRLIYIDGWLRVLFKLLM